MRPVIGHVTAAARPARAVALCRAAHRQWCFGRCRQRRWQGSHLQRHPICRAAGGPVALESAAAGRGLDRGPPSHRLWCPLHAGSHLFGHDLPRHRAQRRLPVPEPVDAGNAGAAKTAGHGLDLWRRFCRRSDVRTTAGWRQPFQEGRRGGVDELPAGHLRIFLASGAGQGIGAQRGGKLWPAGPGGGPQMGQGQHRGLRRRSRQRHDFRRIGGLVFRQRADGGAALPGALLLCSCVGSFSVSALMASPLSQGLFRRAIGESGAYFGDTLRAQLRAETEKAGVEFAKSSLGTDSIEALRAQPAADVLEAASKQGAPRFVPNIDRYFMPESVEAIFAAGKQSHVPLLAGWNADEQSYRSILGRDDPTPENFLAHARSLYGDRADSILKLYPAATAAQARRSAQDLAGDRFIAYGTWKWMEMHLKTGQAPLFRY